MSIEFMHGVLKNEFWLPNTSEIKIKNVVSKPNKHQLAEILTHKMANLPSQGGQFDIAFRKTIKRI